MRGAMIKDLVFWRGGKGLKSSYLNPMYVYAYLSEVKFVTLLKFLA
jgi:hypothetical protein